jgi:hypothetical protein
VEDGVGKTLRDARKLDLAEVESSTRIRIRFLRALEDEDWEALPGETYTRAFIRTYADFLRLDGALLAERYRRDAGVSPRKRLPRIEPDPIAPAERRRRWAAPSPRILAAIATVGLVAVAIVIGTTSGGGGRSEAPRPDRAGDGGRQAGGGQARQTPKPGVSLRLSARAEVWVCLLGSAGQPLVDGQILTTGGEAGPFRSGSFTVSFGNGEVSMTVNGQQARIPATSSPVGYSIGAGGELRELPEGERPTCT